MDDGNPSEKILVIARNHRVFRGWCDVYGVNWMAPNVIFVQNISHTHGISKAWLVDLGADNPQLRAWIDNKLKAGIYKHLHEATPISEKPCAE